MHPIDPLLAAAFPVTVAVSVGAVVLEAVLLRVRGDGISLPSARASTLSAIGAFGGVALANQLLFVGLMSIAWQHRLLDLGLGPLAWLAAFVVYDLCFYVAHRAGHEVRLLWCFHSVHHTSEQMQLTTAIRGSVLDFVYLPWFFVWIPLLGVHPGLVLLVEAASRLWGVLIHVSPRLVGRTDRLDPLVVTPSTHRVHHGRDLGYLDRNYGSVLALWDRLLGTWQREDSPPDYGVRSPVDPVSFVDIQVSPWRALWHDVRRASRWTDKLRYCLLAPGWSHDGPDQRAVVLQAAVLD